MIVVKPSFEIIDDINYVDVLNKIENAYRVCYKSEKKGGSADFIKSKIAIGHESPLEHQSISVRITTNRAVTHELVRHRLASYTQESQRYCNYSADKFDNQITFIKPSWVSDDVLGNHLCVPDFLMGTDRMWVNACIDNEQYYFDLLNNNWKPEQARSVLNNSVATSIIVTANLREWRHIFKLRAIGTTGKPHPDMLEIMIPLLEEFKKAVPVIFDDLEVK